MSKARPTARSPRARSAPGAAGASASSAPAKLWGGRFEGALDAHFEAFHSSLPIDRRMWREDVAGSIAWARALARAGVLRPTEARELVRGLEQIGRELESDASVLERSQAEDIHSWVEVRLGELVGELARKLHTGRSRNDQVATDLKLHLKGAAHALVREMHALQQALLEQAERGAEHAMPGYTHLQRAQPIPIAHHALAYIEMLARDRTRIADALERLDTCPLGSGALAGTAYPIDRAELARELGFRAPTRNSLDAVSDRDHACELAFAASMFMVHLSRFAEDWIFFCTQEAGFLTLSDAVTTGSSLMPQKKNPDALELVRGKCGRVLGDLQALLVGLKGLPLAYNKDLQEDKEALFDALDTARACARVVATAVRGARWNTQRCAAESARGYLNATDLADLLVQRGLPFRSAHERAGQAVRAAIELGVELEALPAAERARLLPELEPRDLRELELRAVLAHRAAIGGTAPKAIAAQLRHWRAQLAQLP